MNLTPSNSPQHPVRLPGWRLWFGVFGAPFAWGTMELLGYYLSSLDCSAIDFPGFRLLSIPGLAVLIFILWILMLAVGLAALVVSITAWRGLQTTEENGETFRGRDGFMALWGIGLSSLFLLLTFASGLPNLVLNHCTG